MNLGAINLYPIKSGGAVPVQTGDIAREGLKGDRRWMLIDQDDTFVTQRQCPALAKLEAEIADDGLILVYGDEGERFVPTPDGRQRVTAKIWRDTVDVAVAGEETNIAISRWLKTDLRLVYQDRVARTADERFAPEKSPVSLADGYPILITTTASLRDLNSRLVHDGFEPVPMSRFRPNLVIDETEAWGEDEWRTIRISGLVLDLVKPCARCKITTIDQFDGVPTGDQPLDILRKTRMSANRDVPGVLFGWNAIPRAEGRVDIGDRVEVLERRDGGVVRG